MANVLPFTLRLVSASAPKKEEYALDWYMRERLRRDRETWEATHNGSDRGFQATVAKKCGVSAAHVSTVINSKRRRKAPPSSPAHRGRGFPEKPRRPPRRPPPCPDRASRHLVEVELGGGWAKRDPVVENVMERPGRAGPCHFSLARANFCLARFVSRS